MRRAGLGVVAAATLLGLGLSRTHADPPNSSRYACSVDADCMIVTSVPSCDPCGACEGSRTAVSRVFYDQRARTCRSGARGARRPSTCPPCETMPPDTSAVEAVCREQMCTLRSVVAHATP